MRAFIELDRRFRDLTDKEREDPELLAHWGDREPYLGSSWDELLKSERVIILSEAGAGKTWEMKAQKARLTSTGQNAFFIPIEVLDKEDLRGYLAMETAEAERFDAWLANGEQTAWFFLDAVDELKLTNGKLEIGLGKIAGALGVACNRARIFVSCRPTDWRPVQDMEIFQNRLPIRESLAIAALSGDEAFIAPLRQPQNTQAQQPSVAKLRCVVLERLGKSQIEAFARAEGVADPKIFLAEINRRNAWAFARRPFDLKGLVAGWKETGTLGSLRQQHETDIEISLRDDPDHPGTGRLSKDRALRGAERLALAMARTKTRTIRVPDHYSQEIDSSSLDAFSILTDWTDDEVKTLLRRSIFDPATYGRVRFHHRSIQEFLATSCLDKLHEAGLSKRQFLSLLFADTYSEQVVIPSMRPIVAWLSQKNSDVCREVLNREPEILILHGDPETLPLDIRTKLVRNYVAAYSSGTWRGLQMPTAEVQRLASPVLAQEIKRCWDESHNNEEVREFLLKLVWLGAIQDCTETAFEALMNASFGVHVRTLAAGALAECQKCDLLRTAANDMLATPSRWPDNLVYNSVENFFPKVISATELAQLIRRTPEPARTIGGFSWTLYYLVDHFEPGSDTALSLRNTLRDLVWDGCEVNSDWYRLTSKYSYLTPTLAKLCQRKLALDGSLDKDWIYTSVIANRFHDETSHGREDFQQLRQFFAQNIVCREILFWTEMNVVDAIDPDCDRERRRVSIEHKSLFNQITVDDWNWLFEAIKEANPLPKRDLALRSLIRLYFWRGGTDVDLSALKMEVQDSPCLMEILTEKTAPRPPDPEARDWEIEAQQSKERRAAKQQATEQSWLDWKARAEADPAVCFEGERKSETFWVLVKWLRLHQDGSTIALQNWREIRRILGDVIGAPFEKSLQDYWRENQPPVWSRRSPEDYNKISGDQLAALTGLAVEAASNPIWAEKLSSTQALRAAEWGLTELNGFPEWYTTLAQAHRDAVQSALVTEIKAELNDKTLNHPHTLMAVSYGDEALKPLVAAFLKDALLQWPQPPEVEDEEHIYCQNLDRALSILVSSGQTDADIVKLCEARFLALPNRSSAAIWLRGLFACNPERGVSALNEGIKAVPKEQAIGWIGALFGDHDRFSMQISFDIDANLLVDLTKLAYECVRPEDDAHHDGAFTPDARDNAERARNRLLGALIEKPGTEAHRALIALADEPLFAYMPDRLRIMARETAAKDSERAALSPAEYRDWEKRYETPPRNRDELFQVMMDRLDDIAYDIRHHDFNDRHILKPIKIETDMQPLLARKLVDASRGQYQVVREDEVADKKKPDLRLASSSSSADRCVIEIKIGDNWSVSKLEEAIKDQLVGQYLRHESCAAGCLLVTYAGRKGFQAPDTGASISFQEVIERLKQYATSLEQEEGGGIRLDVFALDLRDPLAPATSAPKKVSRRSKRKL